VIGRPYGIVSHARGCGVGLTGKLAARLRVPANLEWCKVIELIAAPAGFSPIVALTGTLGARSAQTAARLLVHQGCEAIRRSAAAESTAFEK
jgi:hypothetical protein